LIHSDVWGPAQNISLGGSPYFISFIDDYTRHTWIYLIERKSEVIDCFRNLKGFVENESGRKINAGGKPIFVTMDTSPTGIGWVINQEDKDDERYAI
jgi:hypothetical protein